VCCLTSCSIVVHSQDVSQPPEPSFCNYIFQFPWTSFFLISSFLTLSLHVIPNSLIWNLWWAASYFFICVTDSGHDSAPKLERRLLYFRVSTSIENYPARAARITTTWQHRSRDHSTRNRPFPIGGPLNQAFISNGFRLWHHYTGFSRKLTN